MPDWLRVLPDGFGPCALARVSLANSLKYTVIGHLGPESRSSPSRLCSNLVSSFKHPFIQDWSFFSAVAQLALAFCIALYLPSTLR